MYFKEQKYAVAYYRTFSECQRGRFSFDNQVNEILDYSAKKGIEIVEVFEDVSPKYTTEIPGFQEALVCLYGGGVDVFIIADSNLLHNDPAETLGFIDRLHEKEIAYISVCQDLDTRTEDGQIFFRQLRKFYQTRPIVQEDQHVGEMGAKLQKKANQKLFGGRTPLGYGKKWEVSPAEADVIRELFLAYLRLKSLSKLEDFAREKKFTQQVGLGFKRGTLQNILQNRAYLGEYHQNEKKNGVEHWVNHHVPLIEPDIFEHAQRIILSKKRK